MKGPERQLQARYRERIGKAGRSIGVSGCDLVEVADGAGPDRTEREGGRLIAARPPGVLVALDERGSSWTSAELAGRLERWRDAGTPSAAFALGGADGHAPSVRDSADHILALSAMTLPHLLARVVILEQLYRAMTILLGHPYHRAA